MNVCPKHLASDYTQSYHSSQRLPPRYDRGRGRGATGFQVFVADSTWTERSGDWSGCPDHDHLYVKLQYGVAQMIPGLGMGIPRSPSFRQNPVLLYFIRTFEIWATKYESFYQNLQRASFRVLRQWRQNSRCLFHVVFPDICCGEKCTICWLAPATADKHFSPPSQNVCRAV